MLVKAISPYGDGAAPPPLSGGVAVVVVPGAEAAARVVEAVGWVPVGDRMTYCA